MRIDEITLPMQQNLGHLDGKWLKDMIPKRGYFAIEDDDLIYGVLADAVDKNVGRCYYTLQSIRIDLRDHSRVLFTTNDNQVNIATYYGKPLSDSLALQVVDRLARNPEVRVWFEDGTPFDRERLLEQASCVPFSNSATFTIDRPIVRRQTASSVVMRGDSLTSDS